MKAEQLKPGTMVQLDNGATAMVLEQPKDDIVWIRFLDSPFDPDQAGKEGTCSVDEVLGHYTEGDLTKTAGDLA